MEVLETGAKPLYSINVSLRCNLILPIQELLTDYRYSGNNQMYIGVGGADTNECYNANINLYKNTIVIVKADLIVKVQEQTRNG